MCALISKQCRMGPHPHNSGFNENFREKKVFEFFSPKCPGVKKLRLFSFSQKFSQAKSTTNGENKKFRGNEYFCEISIKCEFFAFRENLKIHFRANPTSNPAIICN